jgi:hypothetical protein
VQTSISFLIFDTPKQLDGSFVLQVAPKSTSFGIRKLVAAGSSLMGIPTIFTVPFQFFLPSQQEDVARAIHMV